MTAPALVLLANGSTDDRVVQVYHGLRKRMQEQRPSLPIHLAFLDGCPPTGPQVVSTLVTRRVTEVVFVPLDLTRACDPNPLAEQMANKVQESHPGLHVSLSRPLGPAPELLSILDLRLRQALGATRAMELDALVLSVPFTGDPRGHALISRRARQWRTHHKLPVQIAHSDNSGPNVATAINTLRSQGRRSIAVGSLFLGPDEAYKSQAELALHSGAVAVSAPLGIDDRLLDLAMARYSVAALGMLDECEDVAPQEDESEFDFDNAPVLLHAQPPAVLLEHAAM
jgi:sirohydrochlorin ferrochelatase